MITPMHMRVIYGLAVGLWALFLIVDGQSITSNFFKPYSWVFIAIVGFATAFEKFFWKWPRLYPWFVRVPNLTGTYKAGIHSQWVDPATGTRRGPIPAYLVIRQSLSSIHIRLYTAESESLSLLAAFVKAADGRQELLFTYRNEPRIEVRGHSAIHYGTARLNLGQTAEQLAGSYWTDRSTIGEITARRISRAMCHSFAECGVLPGAHN